MLGWITFGGLVLVFGIIADDWYGERSRKPLSHMKPDANKISEMTGMQEIDMANLNKKIARHKNK